MTKQFYSTLQNIWRVHCSQVLSIFVCLSYFVFIYYQPRRILHRKTGCLMTRLVLLTVIYECLNFFFNTYMEFAYCFWCHRCCKGRYWSSSFSCHCREIRWPQYPEFLLRQSQLVGSLVTWSNSVSSFHTFLEVRLAQSQLSNQMAGLYGDKPETILRPSGGLPWVTSWA